MNIKVIKTFQELDDMQLNWERLQDHLNNDFSQFKLICELRPEIESPFVTVIEQNNLPHALLAGRLERTQFAPSIGYLNPLRVSAKVLTVIHQGLLGHLDEKAAKESVNYLWSLLDSGVADAIEFHYVSEHSMLLLALKTCSSEWFCEHKLRWNIHREMDVPSEGGFLEHKVRSKHRSQFRKKQRELESAFPEMITWHWLSQFDDISVLCNRLEEVAMRSYQRGLGAGFIDNEEYRQRFALFALRGQLRVQLLEIDGKVRAFWFGIIYKGVFHSSETGYDPDLREYEVGTLIFIRMVDELAREGVKKFDFGLGDALYKQRFGDHSWREMTVWLFAPTAKGMLLRLMLRLSIIVDSTARLILQRVGMVGKLKAAWRKRLAKVKLEVDKRENNS